MLKKKELFWFIGTLLFTLILVSVIFGFEGLKPGALTDINVYDTYFVVPTLYFLISLCVLIFFGVYLIRMLRKKFKSKIVNLIFLVTNILLVLKLTQLISISNTLAQTSGYETDMGTWLNIFSNVLLLSQVTLLVLLTFCGIKTGLNYYQSK